MTRLILYFFLTGFCLQASAQDSSLQKKGDSSMPAERSMEEVVIAATRFPEKNKFIPQSVISLPSKKIEWLNQPTVGDLLSQSGQILVQKSQLGGGSPVIRGFEANKVLIVVDGVRMNNAIFRGGHLQNVISMDNNYLGKAEVLLGPASVMYGSDALGGVMCFYTKNPLLADNKKGRVLRVGSALRYSSASQENHVHVDVNAGGKHFASFTSFSFSNFGDLRQGKNRSKDYPEWGIRSFEVVRINNKDSMQPLSNNHIQSPSGYTQYDAVQKFLYKKGAMEHILNFQLSTSSDIPRYDRLTEVSAGKAKFAEWYYGPQDRLLASYQLNIPKSYIFDKGQITSAFQVIRESRHSRRFGSDRLDHRYERVRVWSANADFFKVSGKHELNYGLELTHNDVHSKAHQENISSGVRAPLDTRYPDGGSQTASAAAYVSFLKKISKKISFNAGSRFSINQLKSNFMDTSFFPFPFTSFTQNNRSISGNAGLVYFPVQTWKISALVSSGFRTPNVDDLSKVFESNNSTLIIPNPEIKPEKTLNYELNGQGRVYKRLKAGFNFWYTSFRNILTLDSALFKGSRTVLYQGNISSVFSMVNKDKAYLWGGGMTITADLLSENHNTATGVITDLQLFATAQYTYGRIRRPGKDYPLDHIPPVFGKVGITGKIRSVTAEFSLLFNGTKDSSNYNLKGEDNQLYSADPIRGYTPSWTCLNTRVSLKLATYLTAQLAIENITDRFYRVFSSGISAPGRNFVLSLRGNF